MLRRQTVGNATITVIGCDITSVRDTEKHGVWCPMLERVFSYSRAVVTPLARLFLKLFRLRPRSEVIPVSHEKEAELNEIAVLRSKVNALETKVYFKMSPEFEGLKNKVEVLEQTAQSHADTLVQVQAQLAAIQSSSDSQAMLDLTAEVSATLSKMQTELPPSTVPPVVPAPAPVPAPTLPVAPPDPVPSPVVEETPPATPTETPAS